ncbi:GNAT family N-acetyltransferase [Mastigocoleus testarum]|uniref:Acetyltransferase n=1 Tax=Mastigocoleus testarum BC008 TaxID=371196 RepID=A0A0V7ZIA0_9CYAN|nr:GNAT family N-acetyltransferase [Mastigocoleus testarum]KST63865.1 acetyltransferase [Mastigocoleus testarum BC008]KST64200.1 acetyltransferase [Mastigocoleus testarum BC008]
MIRPTVPNDTNALLALANAAIGFEPNELEELSKMLTDYFNSENESGDFWLTDDDNGVVAAAYCAPEKMTNGTWNLLFLAVRPDRQGQGCGTAMIRYVEQILRERGGRLLLIETLASFERTREFYCKCGYEEEARIRDFYEAGYDKIVYRKVLGDGG